MRGWPGRIARIARLTLLHFYRDNGFDRSATVAFYALLALGPLLYLAGMSVGALLQTEHGIEQAMRALAAYIPPEAAPTVEEIAANLPRSGRLLLIAVPGLLWVATSGFSALDYAINIAFGTAPRQTLWHSRANALGILAAGFGLLGLGALVTSVPAPIARLVSRPLASASGSRALLLTSGFLAFVIFFRALPRGRVGWRAAAAGAALALLLWDTARRLFTGALAQSPAFGLLTGTVAGTVALLLWIYAAVAAILLGAELAAVLNGNRGSLDPP
jgi:membrane protein